MTITTYDTYTLSTEEELARCPVFHVDQFNWGGSYRPLTTGRLGFLEDRWSIRLTLPLTLVQALYPDFAPETGSRFTCNFYKIKESKGLTHFASFAPITAPEPDFHLPEYFAHAQIHELPPA